MSKINTSTCLHQLNHQLPLHLLHQLQTFLSLHQLNRQLPLLPHQSHQLLVHVLSLDLQKLVQLRQPLHPLAQVLHRHMPIHLKDLLVLVQQPVPHLRVHLTPEHLILALLICKL